MRRQHAKLKWVLVLVILIMVVSLVYAFIPTFSEYGSGVAASDIAEVGSESVSAREFQTAYQNNIQRMGSQVSPEMLRAFGFDKQVLDYLIKQRVVTVEARRLGLQATDAEVQDKVLSTPPFVDAGGFIGHARYQQILERNNMTVQEFEEGVRSQILAEKLRSFLTAGVTVSDADVEKEYRRINEKAKLDYFVIEPSKFESKVSVSDAELRDYYEKNKTRYQMPEQRKAKYIFVDAVKYHKEATATDQELRDYFNQHVEDYRLKELVTAQHILFKTEGKNPEEVEAIRKKALSVLDRVKKGEDFSTLAKQFSDDSSAANGGNLGDFPRGQMVPEFDKAAFSLGVGATSDLVQTQFGFHIIKVLKKQEPKLRTFDEMKEAVRSIVLGTKGAAKAEDVSRLVTSDLATNKNLEAVAQKNGVEVRTTPMLTAGQKVEGLSNSPEFMRQVFSLGKDEIGIAVKNDEGYAIPSVAEIQPSHPGTFDETKARVLTDLKTEKAGQMATEKSKEAVDAVKAGKDLSTVAKLVGMEVKTSEPVARGGSAAGFWRDHGSR
jgi:peptidyl-prolyl cis-trans isomerase D